MSYVPSRKTKLVYDLMNKRISEEQFFLEFPAVREKIGMVILDLLECGLAEKNADLIESAIPLAYRYGLSNEYLGAFNILALVPWHFRHEDVVFALGLLKDPTSIEVLAKTALAKHPYLENDEFFALGSKSIYVLRNIGTSEAIQKIGELARNENEVLKSTAIGRLKEIANKGESDALRAEAQSLLKIP